MPAKRNANARTNARMRREFQRSGEPTAVLARRYGICPKTVAKWRKRATAAELPKGPKRPTSSVLSVDEEAVIVAFRKLTRLPLDDCWARLKTLMPTLKRSGLHRCLRRWRISRVPRALRPPVTFGNAGNSGHFDLDAYSYHARGGRRCLLMATNLQRKIVFAQWADTLDAEVVAIFIDAFARGAPIPIASIAASPRIFLAPTNDPDTAEGESRPSVFVSECRKRSIAPFKLATSGPAPPRIAPGWGRVAATAKPKQARATKAALSKLA